MRMVDANELIESNHTATCKKALFFQTLLMHTRSILDITNYFNNTSTFLATYNLKSL